MHTKDTALTRSQPQDALRHGLVERAQLALDPAWNDIASYIQTLFRGDHCVINLHYGRGQHETLAAAGLTPDWSHQYEERFHAINPFLAEGKRRRPHGGEPITHAADNLIPYSRVRDHAFAREFYAPLGVNDALGTLIFDGSTPLGHVAIRRGSTGVRYGAAEEVALRSVLDLLEAAFRRSRALRELRARTAAFDHLASGSSAGMILFDAGGRAIDAAGGDGELLARACDLLAPAARDFAAGHGSHGGSLAGGEGASELVYDLRRTPIEGRTRVLCVLREGVRESSGGALSVPSGVRFTGRERDVVTLLARGLDNLSIARGLGIGLYTTKDHVKAIFRKLSVHTRAQAVAVLMGGDASGVPPKSPTRATS